MTDLVRIKREGAVLCVALNRPQKKNAITAEMWRGLYEALETASQDDNVAALLISGEAEFHGRQRHRRLLAGARSEATDNAPSPGGLFIRALARFEKPLVAAIEVRRSASARRFAFTAILSTPRRARAF